MSVLINEKLHSHRLKWRCTALASGDLKHWHVSGFTHCMVGGGGAATD